MNDNLTRDGHGWGDAPVLGSVATDHAADHDAEK